MPKMTYTLFFFVVVMLSYIWVRFESLSYYYTPQFISVLMLILVGLYYMKKRKKIALLEKIRIELPLLSAIFLIIIGATGNIDSLFFPLAYIHIFILLITLDPINAIASSILLMIFHLSITPINTEQQLATVISIPIMMCLFLFTKKQLEQRFIEKQLVELREQQLSDQQTAAGLFIATFLLPKLEALSHLAQYPEANKDIILKQLSILEEEAGSVVNEIGDEEVVSSRVVG